MKHHISIGILAFGILGLISSQAQTETIKIGAITSLTGRFATFGKMQKAGFNVALSEINAKGGILGRKVEMLLEDDASDTNKALAAAEKLQNAGAPLMIGAYSSGITKPLSQYAARVKMPLLVATAVDETITKPGNDYTFRVNNASSAYSDAFFELFRQYKSIKKLAILNSNDAFGNSIATDVTRMSKSGFSLASDKYDSGLTDFRPILNRFKALEPDVVMFASYEADSIAIMRQAKEIGLKPKFFFAGFATGFALPSFPTNATDAADNMLVSVAWNDDVRYPGAQQLYKKLQTELGEEPSQHAAQSYGAMLAAADAIKRSNTSVDREKVRDALETTRISTGFGPVRFLDYRGYKNQNPVISLITQIQKGKPVTVFPERIAEGKIVVPK
jgi:branched-chain amino acid transport system substrate-binding protein